MLISDSKNIRFWKPCESKIPIKIEEDNHYGVTKRHVSHVVDNRGEDENIVYLSANHLCFTTFNVPNM